MTKIKYTIFAPVGFKVQYCKISESDRGILVQGLWDTLMKLTEHSVDPNDKLWISATTPNRRFGVGERTGKYKYQTLLGQLTGSLDKLIKNKDLSVKQSEYVNVISEWCHTRDPKILQLEMIDVTRPTRSI
jgi:hypothetical protein